MQYRPRYRIGPVGAVLLALLVVPALLATAEDADRPPAASQPAKSAPPTSQPAARRGAFVTRFDQRSDLSRLPAMFGRFGFNPPRRVPDYQLDEEPFKVIVPESYDPATPFGVLVFVNPSDGDIRMGDAYAEVLASHKLIFVGAVNTGNKREIWHRVGLALDALHNIQQNYTIDPQRQYISGMSGGGRVASRLGIMYADAFTGAFPLCGCDYFREIPVPGNSSKMWRRAFNRPPPNVMRLAEQRNRYVLLTGETDGNRLQTQGVYNLYRRDGFQHVTYLEVPHMGHTYPPLVWFDKGLTALDAIPADQPAMSQPAPATGKPRVTARRRLILARRYLRARKTESARKHLRLLLEQHPDSDEAATARRLLEELGEE